MLYVDYQIKDLFFNCMLSHFLVFRFIVLKYVLHHLKIESIINILNDHTLNWALQGQLMRPNGKKNNANEDNITWLNVSTGTDQLAIY